MKFVGILLPTVIAGLPCRGGHFGSQRDAGPMPSTWAWSWRLEQCARPLYTNHLRRFNWRRLLSILDANVVLKKEQKLNITFTTSKTSAHSSHVRLTLCNMIQGCFLMPAISGELCNADSCPSSPYLASHTACRGAWRISRPLQTLFHNMIRL